MSKPANILLYALPFSLQFLRMPTKAIILNVLTVIMSIFSMETLTSTLVTLDQMQRYGLDQIWVFRFNTGETSLAFIYFLIGNFSGIYDKVSSLQLVSQTKAVLQGGKLGYFETPRNKENVFPRCT